MDFIKNNQLLKVELSYDQDNLYFEDFIQDRGIARIGNGRDYSYLKIGKPDGRHYFASYLVCDSRVREELEWLRHNIGINTMPALTTEEAGVLSEQVANEDWGNVDFEIARRGLLSVTHQAWYDSVTYYDDYEDALRPYLYTAHGYSQGDWANLYLIGMDEREALGIKSDFELYAYDTPYQFRVELIDCQSGDTLDEDSLGGIYDDADLTCLKEELETAIKNLNGIDGEVMALAFGAIRPLDYTNIDNNF